MDAAFRPVEDAREPVSPRAPRFAAGVVTGAADDDPSGLATYSQAGAQFGYGLAWSLLLTTPLMIAVQAASARVAIVTGHGLAAAMRRRLPLPVLYALVALLVVANTLNVAADLAAVGAVVETAIGGNSATHLVLIGSVVVAVTAFLSYRRYARVLKWLTLSLLAYVAVLWFVPLDWRALAAGLVPPLTAPGDYWLTTMAVLGTTISPYLFFWQAGQEVEELRADPRRRPLLQQPGQARRALARVRLDTVAGMLLSNGVALCVVVAAAATLHAHGVREIGTAEQAAEALRPLAGDGAFALFGLGIVGAGLLAVPILAASAAYAVAEALGWPGGLDLTPRTAPGFYGILASAVAIGVALDLGGLDPLRSLYWSAVVNGAIAPPIMAALLLTAADRRVMGVYAIGPRLRALGWFATASMTAVALAAVVSA